MDLFRKSVELTRKDLETGTVKLVELLKEIYQEEEDKEPELISEELYSKLNFEESYPSNSNSEKEEEKEKERRKRERVERVEKRRRKR